MYNTIDAHNMYLVITGVVYESTAHFDEIYCKDQVDLQVNMHSPKLSPRRLIETGREEQIHMESKQRQINFRNFLFFSLTAEVTSILFTSTFQENL